MIKKTKFLLFLIFLSIGLIGQIEVINNDVLIGTPGTIPMQKLEVEGNIVLNSSETEGSLHYKRNHIIHGKNGRKRLQFSTDESTQLSWSWIQMFGAETCAECTVSKRGVFGLGGQKIEFWTNSTGSSHGQIMAEFKADGNSTFNGDVTAPCFVGSTNCYSDIRLKKAVQNYSKGLTALLALQPVQFMYNGKGGTRNNQQQIGLIAQEVQQVAPELVVHERRSQEDNESYLQIKESEIKYIIINAVQDLNEKVDSLIKEKDDEIRELKEKIEKLKMHQR